ncbi:hypothetical protein JCM19232_3776 [Vibrio ishigakensis]|uniref:Uncharacterized protein n=1 Tax=Vibrio ishigakensis TaxID=1481914 RepID=A0A0B8PDA3_9VIBR|nr:hypothetical protein JCM19232_3776 [Vibrio ishigakensis]
MVDVISTGLTENHRNCSRVKLRNHWVYWDKNSIYKVGSR